MPTKSSAQRIPHVGPLRGAEDQLASVAAWCKLTYPQLPQINGRTNNTRSSSSSPSSTGTSAKSVSPPTHRFASHAGQSPLAPASARAPRKSSRENTQAAYIKHILRAAWLAPLAAAFIATGCGGSRAVSPQAPASLLTPAELKQDKKEGEEKQAQETVALTKHVNTEHHHEAIEAKRKAKAREAGERAVRLLHQEEREGKIEKALTPAQAAHEQAEYNRRSAEGEHKLKEDQRRANGELTPEEQEAREDNDSEAAAEVEAIREGERLKSEGN